MESKAAEEEAGPGSRLASVLGTLHETQELQSCLSPVPCSQGVEEEHSLCVLEMVPAGCCAPIRHKVNRDGRLQLDWKAFFPTFMALLMQFYLKSPSTSCCYQPTYCTTHSLQALAQILLPPGS